MRPALLVATAGWDVESWGRRMAALLPEHEILCTDRNGVYTGPGSNLERVHYLLAWRPVQETLDRLPRLRVILSAGAGVDRIFALQRLPDVPIVRIVDADLTSRMTEYVVWRVLDHARLGSEYRRLQQERTWTYLEPAAAREVTVGIMGLGRMALDAAAILLRLGFKIRGWSRTAKDIEGVTTFHGKEGLEPFLAETDILVSLLPLTPETRGLINRNVLGKLRPDGPLGGPVLINAGRGGCHVESDVVEALGDRTLVGASLDVFETEPLSSDSPLWGMGNVTITPHVAAISDPAALAGQIAEQILAYERGEPLKNCVDPERGY